MKRTTALLLGLLVGYWPAAPVRASWSSSAVGSATAIATTIASPTALAATCGDLLASVKVTWTATTSPWADGYEIRWGTSPGVYTSRATARSLTYTSPTLSLGTYYFVVRATKGEWRSTDSNEVSKRIVSVLGVATCQ
jgi:hypothetical protein